MRTQQEVNAIINQLCIGLKPLFPQGAMEAILFGSYARGEADADSDIDVILYYHLCSPSKVVHAAGIDLMRHK